MSHSVMWQCSCITDNPVKACCAAVTSLAWHVGLMTLAVIPGVGAILSTAAVALPMLMIGKLIYGVGIAFALHAAPPYLAEMGHPSIRGLLIGCATRGYPSASIHGMRASLARAASTRPNQCLPQKALLTNATTVSSAAFVLVLLHWGIAGTCLAC